MSSLFLFDIKSLILNDMEAIFFFRKTLKFLLKSYQYINMNNLCGVMKRFSTGLDSLGHLRLEATEKVIKIMSSTKIVISH